MRKTARFSVSRDSSFQHLTKKLNTSCMSMYSPGQSVWLDHIVSKLFKYLLSQVNISPVESNSIPIRVPSEVTYRDKTKISTNITKDLGYWRKFIFALFSTKFIKAVECTKHCMIHDNQHELPMLSHGIPYSVRINVSKLSVKKINYRTDDNWRFLSNYCCSTGIG